MAEALPKVSRGRLAAPPKRDRKTNKRVLQVGSVVVVLGIWQIVGSLTNPLLFVGPWQTLTSWISIIADGELPAAFVTSFEDFVVGLGAAVVVGLFVGMLAGRYRFFEYTLDPYINLLQSTPMVAFIPLLITWFGVGRLSLIMTVFLLSVFVIIVNTEAGVQNTSQSLLDVGRSFGMPERAQLRHIVYPSAIPYIMAGLRLAVAKALIGVFIGEMDIKLMGLGGLITSYGNTFATGDLLAGILTASVLGLLVISVVNWLSSRLAPWSERSKRSGF